LRLSGAIRHTNKENEQGHNGQTEFHSTISFTYEPSSLGIKLPQ
jgi:hypothetical protein